MKHLPWNAGVPPHAPCMSDLERSFSYAQVEQHAAGFAEQLTRMGIGPGDTVAIKLPNRLELLIGILAAWRIGACATPINPTFTEQETRYQLDDSKAAVLVTDHPVVPDFPTVSVDDMQLHPTRDSLIYPLAPDTLALLIYTSGSTGRPKGVMLDHANLEAMASQSVQAFHLTSADHSLGVLPLFHVNSIITGFLAPIYVGAQLTLLERFAPAAFITALESTQATYFSAVPAIYARLAKLPDGSFDSINLRFAVCGAAPMDAKSLEEIEHRLGVPIIEGYGLTEATCASTINPLNGTRKIGTVGVALPGQQVAVVDEAGERLPAGQPGEVVIAGPTVMRGYYGKPEETSKAIRDGWLHTGDIGVMDDDGYLRIINRIKDMVIRGGENLYPAEIEAQLLEHPDVDEAIVVGAPHPVLGEVPVAYLVLKPGAEGDVEDFRAHCQQRLAKIKIPENFFILDEMPRNAVGKYDKPLLRQQLSESRQTANAS